MIRKQRFALLALILLVGGAWVALAQVPPAQAVRAQQISLTDAQGRVTATLENATGGREPVLTMFDSQGEARVRMTVTADGPHLFVIDRNGRTRDFFGGPTIHPATK